MKTLLAILIVTTLTVSAFGQTLKVKLYNKTGYDIDSVSVANTYIGLIKKDSSTAFLTVKDLNFRNAIVKGKSKDINYVEVFRTGLYNESEGIEFDITLTETKEGYKIYWIRHK